MLAGDGVELGANRRQEWEHALVFAILQIEEGVGEAVFGEELIAPGVEGEDRDSAELVGVFCEGGDAGIEFGGAAAGARFQLFW